MIDIENVHMYDPRKVSDKVLVDDWRIVAAWYSSWRSGKKMSYDAETIINAASIIYHEMKKRDLAPGSTTENESTKELIALIKAGKLKPPKEALEERKKAMAKDEADQAINEQREKTIIDKAGKLPDKIILIHQAVGVTGSNIYGTGDPNDSDIVLKGARLEGGKFIYHAGKTFHLKLSRALEEIMGLKNLQYIESESGPTFDHLPIYSLALVRVPELKIERVSDSEPEFAEHCYDPGSKHKDSSEDIIPGEVTVRYGDKTFKYKLDGADIQDSITIFKWFKQPKPTHGRREAEIYSQESVSEVLKAMKEWNAAISTGIYIEPKYDGMRIQAHKEGDRVEVITEDGQNITKKVPELAKELLSMKNDFVAEAELELFINGKHQNRADTAGTVNKGELPERGRIRATFYDVMIWNGKDVWKLLYKDRLQYIDKMKKGNIVPSKRVLAKGINRIWSAIVKAGKVKGSEGAMLKLPTYIYELDGSTSKMIKFKKERRIIAKVLKRVAVKGNPDTFVFYGGIKRPDGSTAYLGRTFAKKLDANIGDKIEVVFVDLSLYTDPNTNKQWFNWWAPRVIGKSTKKATTWKEAIEIAMSTKGVEGTKKEPKTDEHDFQDIMDRFGFRKISKEQIDEVDSNKYIFYDESGQAYICDQNPMLNYPKPEREMPAVVQAHVRGRSVHLDLRIEMSKQFLIGWTIALEKGLSKRPENFTEAKQLVAREIIPLVEKHMGDPLQKMIALPKPPEPHPWLTFQGRTEKQEVGATRHEPGDFVIIDRPKVQFGSQKQWFHEYFMKGKIFNGRIVIRQIPNRKQWKKTGEGTFSWMIFNTKPDSRPYVISRRAVNQKWITPQGISALPSSVRAKIPEKYHFWKPKETSKRVEIRELLFNALKKKEVKVDQKTAKFKLQRQTFKGQMVKRLGPTYVRQHLMIKDGKMQHYISEQDFLHTPTSTLLSAADMTRWEAKPGDIPPKTSLNPTKNTGSRIEILDEGDVLIMEDKPEFKKMMFKGRHLKGLRIFKREQSGGQLYSFEKSQEGPE